MSRRVLLTGSEGFIGSELQEVLSGEEVELLTMDILGEPDVVADVTTEEAAQVMFGFDPDVVINLAGVSGFHGCREVGKARAFVVNGQAPPQIAELLPDALFIQASTCSNYGARHWYSASKQAAESALKRAERRAPTVICRFGTVVGVSSNTRYDLPAAKMAASAVQHGVVRVLVKKCMRPWISVKALAETLGRLAVGDVEPRDRGVTVLPLVQENLTIQAMGHWVAAAAGLSYEAVKRCLRDGSTTGYWAPAVVPPGRPGLDLSSAIEDLVRYFRLRKDV